MGAAVDLLFIVILSTSVSANSQICLFKTGEESPSSGNNSSNCSESKSNRVECLESGFSLCSGAPICASCKQIHRLSFLENPLSQTTLLKCFSASKDDFSYMWKEFEEPNNRDERLCDELVMTVETSCSLLM